MERMEEENTFAYEFDIDDSFVLEGVVEFSSTGQPSNKHDS